MAKKSPTALSMSELLLKGYTAQKVEYWNPFAKRRIDLFNVIDIVAVKEGVIGVLGIQATTSANINSRIKKAINEPKLWKWLDTGNMFEVWGWKNQKEFVIKKISIEDENVI